MLDYADGIKKKREKRKKLFRDLAQRERRKGEGKREREKGDDKTQNYVESSKPYKYKAPKRDG